MIFAVAAGSEGSGSERYVAYLPFVLAPGASLGSLESPVTSTEGSLELKLEKLHHLHAVSLGPFSSTDVAACHLDRLRASLLWLSLEHAVGVSYSKILGDVKLFDAPQPVHDSGLISQVAAFVGWSATDGHYDAEKALIRPDHKRLMRWETGQVSVVIGIGVENFFKSLKEALLFSRLQDVMANEKLKLAIELYATYRFELSHNAQLITLVTALESLIPDMEIAACSATVLTQAKEVVKAGRDQYKQDSAEWSAVNHLLSRIGLLKTEAIATTLRDYVSLVASRHPELGEPEELSTKLRDVYSVRSTLLHEGHPPSQGIGEQLSFLREFVPRLLATLYQESATGPKADDDRIR